MGKLSEVETKRYTICLWGKPKIGKTVLASQFPSPFFIDLDGGISSVRALRREKKLSFDFDVIELDEEPTEDEDFLKLCGKTFGKLSAWEKAKKLNNVLCRKMPKDSTLVVDNTSRLNEYLVAYIMKRSGHRPLQIQDWGEVVNEFTDFLNDIKSATCNVILISHEEYRTDEVTKETERLILLNTKIRFRIPSVVSEFLYMSTRVRGPRSKREVIRFLQSTPDQQTATGSRALIPDIENPTYEKLRPYLERALNRKLPGPTWR